MTVAVPAPKNPKEVGGGGDFDIIDQSKGGPNLSIWNFSLKIFAKLWDLGG